MAQELTRGNLELTAVKCLIKLLILKENQMPVLGMVRLQE